MLNLLSAAVIDLGGTYFAIVDVVFFAILLIAGVYGAIRGFLKQILSVLGIGIAIFENSEKEVVYQNTCGMCLSFRTPFMYARMSVKAETNARFIC